LFEKNLAVVDSSSAWAFRSQRSIIVDQNQERQFCKGAAAASAWFWDMGVGE